jgi:hypothetical protein
MRESVKLAPKSNHRAVKSENFCKMDGATSFNQPSAE